MNSLIKLINAKNLPASIRSLERSITLVQALQEPNQISALRQTNRLELETLMVIIISQTAESLNIARTITEQQIVEAAQLIVSEYWWLRPEEILFAFKRAKTGAYGADYNRMDTTTIMRWIKSYDETDRATALEHLRLAEQKKQRQEEEQQQEVLRPLYPKAGELPFALRQSQEFRQQKQSQHRSEMHYQQFKQTQNEKKRPIF